MDEYLIDLADNRIATIDFFRQYMAGFLISKRERAMSLCGSDYVRENTTQPPDPDNRDLMCIMFGTTRSIQMERNNTRPYNLFIPVADLAMNYLSTATSRYPLCNDISIDNQTLHFFTENTRTNLSTYNEAFTVDGTVRESTESYLINLILPRETLPGRQHAQFGNSEITGATIYYNNQVTDIY